MGTGMGTQAGSLLPSPPCSASATLLPLQRALCSRRTRTARVCSPSWPLVPTGLSRCGSRQDGDTYRQLPVPCITSPSPAFWLQQRCWGPRQPKNLEAEQLAARTEPLRGWGWCLAPHRGPQSPGWGTPIRQHTPKPLYRGGCAFSGGVTAKAKLWQRQREQGKSVAQLAPPRVPSSSLSSFPGPGEPEEAGRQPARMLEQR